VLVLIGVGVALASSSGGDDGRAAAAAALRRTNARQAVQLRNDGQALASLRATVKADAAQLAAIRGQLVGSRANTRCWYARARHHKHAPKCAPPQPSPSTIPTH
jgi:hypothetical protein